MRLQKQCQRKSKGCLLSRVKLHSRKRQPIPIQYRHNYIEWIRLLGNLVDHQPMRAIANIILSSHCDPLTRKWHQPRVLRRRRRFVINGYKDGAIIPQKDKRRAVFGASLGASDSDGFIETLGIGACGVENPASESYIGAAICSHGETSQRSKGYGQQLTEVGSSFCNLQNRAFVEGVKYPCVARCSPILEYIAGSRGCQVARPST